MFPIASLGRMLVSAAIRRALWRSPKAWLVVGFLVGLVLMSISTARAQDFSQCATNAAEALCQNKQRAHAEAQAAVMRSFGSSPPPGAKACLMRDMPTFVTYAQSSYGGPALGSFCPPAGVPQGSRIRSWPDGQDCPAGHSWDPVTLTCFQACSSKPDVTVTRPPFAPVGMGNPSSFGQCSGGCYVHYQNMQDGTYVGVHLSNAQCGADGLPDSSTCAEVGRISGPWGCMDPPQECAANQVKDPVTGECKGSVCPVGMILTNTGECANEGLTCPPGQIKAPNGGCVPGEGTCGPGSILGADGTCKRDADGDGTPDDDAAQESFTGGDGCNNPPACSGSPILCGQARIQWRIECNTRKAVNVSGGTCGAMPLCTGENCDLMEYAQLIQQWRTACTLEKLAEGSGGIGGGDGDDDGPPQSWDSVGDASAVVDEIGGTGDPADAFTDGSEGGDGTGELDTSGFGYGTSCPQLPTVQVFDTTIDFNVAAPDMCRWFQLAGQIVLVLAALTSLRIIAASGGA